MKFKREKAITLISLVITIIILIIIAGVAINLSLGENGIFRRAKEARDKYLASAEDEQEALNELEKTVENIVNGQEIGNGGETTHTVKTIQYTWEELGEIAKLISNNYGTEEGKVNNQTVEVAVSINGKSDTLGIGNITTVDGKTVRILGFNHDELVDKTVYGGTNTYAGISFEYVDLIKSAFMNSTNINANGWGECELRTTLNGTTYNSLENKEQIKQVKKQYIKDYDDASSVTESKDYLWLLSCSEIWNNGDTSGAYGYAKTKEGERYKYYDAKLGSTDYSSSSLITTKSSVWWLRSPSYNSSSEFCNVNSRGYCNYIGASYYNGVAPGFAI